LAIAERLLSALYPSENHMSKLSASVQLAILFLFFLLMANEDQQQ
jgi:hypothetical protein